MAATSPASARSFVEVVGAQSATLAVSASFIEFVLLPGAPAQPPSGIDPGRQSRNFRRFLARERPHQTARVGLNPPAVPVPPAETAFDPGKQSRNFRQFERPRHRVPRRMSAPAAIAPPVSAPFVVTCIIG